MTPNITPIAPVGPMNPVAGYNPLDLINLLLSEIAQESINVLQLYIADAAAGIEQAWRVVFRALDVDVPSGQWGSPVWGTYGDLNTEAGTTNLQEIGSFLAGVSRWGRVNPNGLYEVQLMVNGTWFSAASLLRGFPLSPVPTGTTQPILYQPGPAIVLFSPVVPAQQVLPTPLVSPANLANPVGAPIAGFAGGFHNVGGQAWSTPGEEDPTHQYTLMQPSMVNSNPAAMVWLKK